MRVLLDTCVATSAREALVTAGHDVTWTGEWDRDPGDREILRHANQNGMVLVTLDKDFGELAIVHRLPHVGIIRLVDVRPKDQGKRCVDVLSGYGDQLQAGAILTVEAFRVRVRPPDDAA